MFKILKYLSESKAAVAAILALLILQAYCDLALPQYTADIVDIGIGQNGIEHVAPEQLRADTFENISLFMDESDAEFLKDFYTEREDGNYELSTKDSEIIAKIDESLGVPMAMLTVLETSEEANIDGIKDMIDSGMLTKDDILDYRDQAIEEYGGIGDSMISQMAVKFVKTEYEAMGLNVGSIQTRFLLNKGGKMLGISVVMMTTAIFVGLLASRTSAKIGMSLRERVFHKVVSFSNAERDQFSTASLITRSTNDIQQVQMVSVMLLRIILYADRKSVV